MTQVKTTKNEEQSPRPAVRITNLSERRLALLEHVFDDSHAVGVSHFIDGALALPLLPNRTPTPQVTRQQLLLKIEEGGGERGVRKQDASVRYTPT